MNNADNISFPVPFRAPLDLTALPERTVQAATLAPLVLQVPVEPEAKLDQW